MLYTLKIDCYNSCRYKSTIFQKVGNYMPDDGKIIKDVVDQFQKVQAHMLIAKEENATKTYASLKKDYKSLKAVLTSLGVNLTDIDEIKE